MASAPSFIASSSARLAGEELKFASYTSNSITARKSWRRSMVKTLAVMAPAQKQRAPAATGSVKNASTVTEKILARASERSQVDPGENVWVNVDMFMTHDIAGPGTLGIFKQEFGPDAKERSHRQFHSNYSHLYTFLFICIMANTVSSSHTDGQHISTTHSYYSTRRTCVHTCTANSTLKKVAYVPLPGSSSCHTCFDINSIHGEVSMTSCHLSHYLR